LAKSTNHKVLRDAVFSIFPSLRYFSVQISSSIASDNMHKEDVVVFLINCARMGSDVLRKHKQNFQWQQKVSVISFQRRPRVH
jgi:hypothetical protein